MSSVTGRYTGQMLKSKDDMKCCFQHQNYTRRLLKLSMTNVRKSIGGLDVRNGFLTLIFLIVYSFSRTPLECLQWLWRKANTTFRRLPLMSDCSVLFRRHPWFLPVGFLGIAPGKFSGKAELGSLEKEGSLKAATQLTSFWKSKFQGTREQGVSLAFID